MKTREQIMARVAKLLRLAQSDNEHEAALATARAQALMDRHNIEEAALALDADVAAEPDEPVVNFTGYDAALDNSNRSRVIWKIRLASVIARANGARVYTRGGTIHMVGRGSDVATVRYLYAYCVREINRLARALGPGWGRTYTNNYRLGCIDAISDTLQAQRRKLHEEMRAETGGGGVALVRINTAIAKVEQRGRDTQEWVERHMKLGKARASGHRHDRSARSHGRQDGRSISMASGPGLSAGARGRLSGGS